MRLILRRLGLLINQNTSNMDYDALKELKEILYFVFDSYDAVKSAKEDDGKIDLKDIPKVLPAAYSLGPAFEFPENPILMWRKLSDEDRAELFELARERFDIEDNTLEFLIEDTLREIGGDIRIAERWMKYSRMKREEKAEA